MGYKLLATAFVASASIMATFSLSVVNIRRRMPIAMLSTRPRASLSVKNNYNINQLLLQRPSAQSSLLSSSSSRLYSSKLRAEIDDADKSNVWQDVLPMEKGSHNSARIRIPPKDSPASATTTAENSSADPFQADGFQELLSSTIEACRELGKSSLWVEVPMQRAGLIEKMYDSGLRFHHAFDETAVLNMWLLDSESKVPDFATHNVGVGAVVVNSQDEILCVRELRKNYMPFKVPTGLAELGEHIDAAAVREVLEETGIRTSFHSVLGFRQTHGLANNRSDLFFICRLDPEEETDGDGNPQIPKPVPQANEIETAEWVPLTKYRDMINNPNGGHPTMQHIIDVFEGGRKIEKLTVESVVPGRSPNAIYFPTEL